MKEPKGPSDRLTLGAGNSPFLRLPQRLRRQIYILAGVPQNVTLYFDSPWSRNTKGRPQDCADDSSSEEEDEAEHAVNRPVPGRALTRCLMLTCRAMSAEVVALFYSRNTFITQDLQPLMMLRPSTIESLRSLRVVLYCVKTYRHHSCLEHYPSRGAGIDMRKDEGLALLAAWKSTAGFLGRHLSPGRLKLSLICDIAEPRLLNHLHANGGQTAAAKAVLATLAHFPPLESCEVCLGSRPSREIHKLARMACERGMVRTGDTAPFRFMSLPAEIRLRVLEYTDLVAPVPSLSWGRGSGYRTITRRPKPAARRAMLSRDRDHHCGTYGVGCFCSSFHSGYSPACRCWQDPQALFLVSKALLVEARDVFFRYHHFEVRNHFQRSSAEVFKEYPGTEYFRDGLLPETRHLLQSLSIVSSGALKPGWQTGWHNTVQGIKQQGSLNLRFLRLGVPYTHPAHHEGFESWAEEAKLDAFRAWIHENFWPLDAGETASLPFGTQSLEVSMLGTIVNVEYRIRISGESPPRPWNLGQKVGWVLVPASRVLLAGNIGPRCTEGASSAPNWIEELCFLRHGRRGNE